MIVLAAGAGTRMRSELPKPLHTVAGLPMLEFVLRAAAALHPQELVVVASRELASRLDVDGLRLHGDPHIVVQDPPRGTGDAVAVGLAAAGDSNHALIVYADHPLVATDDLAALINEVMPTQARIGLITCEVENAAGYGRIARDDAGSIVGIIEQIDDEPSKRAGKTEINSGIQLLDIAWAIRALPRVVPHPTKNEVFLTDLVGIAVGDDGPLAVVSVQGSSNALEGVNDRADLARVDSIMRDELRRQHMLGGVTMIGADSIMIDADVEIGPDTTLLPGTYLQMGSVVGPGCVIGPNSRIDSSVIGANSAVESSVVRSSAIGDGCHVGPFSHIRGGTLIDESVHVGNFVEVKNTRIRPNTRVGHVSYLGDASIGSNTNIGAGTVTCNFDGQDKHRTEIGSNVFIGSDTMLVAPVTVGDGAATGAGSVVTKNVAMDSVVVGVPARPIRKRRTSISRSTKGSEG